MKKVIVIVGPTAVGKTKISIEIAKHFNFEIISGDSVSVYKGLDIGSAKPTKQEQNQAKHHLIDIVDPTYQYSAFDFQNMAKKIIENQNVGFVVGGTGLYISSLLYDYNFDGEKVSEDIELRFKNYDNDLLFEYLKYLDENIDETKIHKNNRKRVLRAIDYIEKNNKSIHKNNVKTKLYDELIIFLNIKDRNLLYERINKRVDLMISNNLEQEVRKLYNDNIIINAIGYKEFIPYFLNEIDLDEVIENIKTNSRNLAKRQMTWFNNQLNAKEYYVNIEDINETIDILIKDITKFLNN